jgi:hypothetical protein
MLGKCIRRSVVRRDGRRIGILLRQLLDRIHAAASSGIQTLFLPFPGRSLIVRLTTLVAALTPMVFLAAERATQIPAACAAWIGQKPNTTVNAAGNAPHKIGIELQNRVQSDLILPNKRFGAIVLVPVLAKRENFLDGD